MPTLLQQDAAAGFPDTAGAIGLLATTTSGYGGAYVSAPIGPTDTLHTRFLFAPMDAAGGRAHLAGGWSADGTVRWSVSWDADASVLALEVPGESPLTTTLPASLDWHHVEAGIDRATGAATLRVNGLLVGSISGATIGQTARCWLGVLAKSRGLAGDLAMDQWVLADAPVGPHRVTPTADHAGDPARWLVVYNADHADGAAWAEHYRAARGVPYANLCGLSLPLAETVDAAAYLALRDAVLAYLDDNGLAGQAVGVLLGLGVPGYVDYAGQGDVVAVSSLLHTDSAGDAAAVNPLHRDPPIDRPTAGALGGVRFTGRIDRATLAEAVALTDRATALMADPPSASVGGTLWLDPVPEDVSVNPLYTAPAAAWAQGEGPGTLRVPVELADDGGFLSVEQDLAFWGWGQASVPVDFFGSDAGRRAVCVQLESADPVADSVRSASATHWLRAALDAGYAASAASSRAYSLSALPQVGVFFAALRRGWTLAEAWCVCQPFVRSGMQMLGDPLMTVAFPMSGFDLFGPAKHLEAIDMSQPAVRLPDSERAYALPLELLPNAGQAGHYLVRRVDALGRPDGATASTHAQPMGEHVVTPPPLPAWPDAGGWRVEVVAGELRTSAVWPVAPRSRGAERVELQAEFADASVQVLWDTVPGVGQTRFSVSLLPPADSARVRWRVVGEAGSTSATAWSAPLIEPAGVLSELQLYEVSP